MDYGDGIYGDDPYRATPDEEMTQMRLRRGMQSQQVVQISLGTSGTDVWNQVTAGRLDAVVIGGLVWVLPEQLRDLIAHSSQVTAATAARWVGPAATALRGFLDARPAVGTVDAAIEQQRPLITHTRNGGHRVLVQGRAVAGFIADRLADQDGSDEQDDTVASWRSLPAGRSLAHALAMLDGVDEQQNATGVFDRAGKSRRIYGWVRCDPRAWPVALSDELHARVLAGRPGTAGRPVPPTDDPWGEAG